MTQTDLLQLHEIKKDFEDRPLLNGVSFEVSAGEILCLLGRSGSGKSTLLRIIAGIEEADSGEVCWNGRNLKGVPTHLRQFGLMFQDYALFPHMNVSENVAFGLRMQGMERTEIDKKVNLALDQVNMLNFASRRVTDLSGGEQQRVALARTLAPQPRLIMLDEPLGALDRALREQLQDELHEVLKKSGIASIYVTHDQEEALALGDRMAFLNDGRIEQIGKPEEIYRLPRTEWVARFLGMQNIFAGEVISTNPLRAKTELGIFQASVTGQDRFTIGEKILLVFTSAQGTGLSETSVKNQIQGICTSCEFKGENYLISLRVNGQLNFSYHSAQSIQPGQNQTIWVSPGNVICLSK